VILYDDVEQQGERQPGDYHSRPDMGKDRYVTKRSGRDLPRNNRAFEPIHPRVVLGIACGEGAGLFEPLYGSKKGGDEVRDFWDMHDNDYRILYILKDVTGVAFGGREFYQEVWASELGPQGSMAFMSEYSYRYPSIEEEEEYRRSLGEIVTVQ